MNRWKNKGMTLPEVIISLAIIAMALLPLMQIMEFTFDNSQRNILYGQVSLVAQQKLESLPKGSERLSEETSGFRPVDWMEVPLEYCLMITPVMIEWERGQQLMLDEITLVIKDEQGKQWQFITRRDRDE